MYFFSAATANPAAEKNTDLFDWDSWRVAVTSTSSVTRGRMGWEVTSTGPVTDGESSVTGQKKQARRPDGWSLSLSE